MTDLEAYEAIEALADAEPWHEDDYLCPNCCTPWKCNGPHLVEGAEVTLFNKPGTVRWVLPEGKGVAVVFEDGMMYWARGEEITSIGERE